MENQDKIDKLPGKEDTSAKEEKPARIEPNKKKGKAILENRDKESIDKIQEMVDNNTIRLPYGEKVDPEADYIYDISPEHAEIIQERIGNSESKYGKDGERY
jgi:hypothetical protein